MRTVFLGSGSGGNCTAVALGGATLLIDCGFSAREIGRRMGVVGIDPGSVLAILVTHEHGDHVRGLDVFARRHAPGAVVWASAGTMRAAGIDRGRIATRAIRPGSSMDAGPLRVTAFRTSHDAAEPMGYRIDAAGESIGVVTDTGELLPDAVEALRDVDVLGIEVNHDVGMLERGPYPAFLKRRIRSARGHLSNDQSADGLERLLSDRLAHVVALHRSRTNNSPALAQAALEGRLTGLGHPARITVAHQDEPVEPNPAQTSLFGV